MSKFSIAFHDGTSESHETKSKASEFLIKIITIPCTWKCNSSLFDDSDLIF